MFCFAAPAQRALKIRAWVCAGLCVTIASLAAAPNTLLGPVEELGMLDDFATSSKSLWKISVGSNVDCRFETGINIPGIANSLGELELKNKDPQDGEAGHNWASMQRALPAGAITKEATGIRLVLGSQPAAQWWINVALHAGTETYSHVIEPTYPNRTMIEQVIPFEEFKSSGRSLDRSQAAAIDEIKLDTSVPKATLLIDRI